MIVKLPSVAGGVVTDATPEELADGQWSSALNVRFRGGYLERAPGMAQMFDAPAQTPYFVAPFRTAVGQLWLHAGLTKIYCDDASSTRTDIGRAAAYTGTTADRWTGGAFNGIFVMNNGVDVPQWWNGSVATDFAALPSWPAGHLCKSMRPFRNFLVAMNITKTGPLRYPFRVLWSAISDPGTYPPGWDITDPTREAGEIDVAGAAGPVVDALQFGDVLLIYTTGSTHAMRYIGGQNVMAVTPVPGGVGMLARNCVASTPLGHVVLTTGDVVLQADGPPRSIADGAVRRRIFETLDNTNAENVAFVCANPADNEAWICYPTDGSATCNRASIWNWKDNTWTFRELRSVTAGATGQTPLAVGARWSTSTDTWGSVTSTWGGGFAGVNDQHLVLAHALPALSLVGYGQDDVGVTPTATAERTGMHFGEPQKLKTIRTVWPRIDAPPGTVVSIEVGASNTPDVAPTWKPAVSYTVGTSAKVDCFATGRYLSIRISNAQAKTWRLRGLDMDIQPQGNW